MICTDVTHVRTSRQDADRCGLANVRAVLQDTIVVRGEAIATVTAEREDPAQIIAAAHRYFVRLAAPIPTRPGCSPALDASRQVAFSSLGPFARRNLRRGIKTGRLHVPDEQVALFATGGALLRVMRAVLDGHATNNADIHHAEGILRMLGLPPMTRRQ